MIEQQKILRVFKLISLLGNRNRRDVKELSLQLETSDKSIYRYLKLLEELGFTIEKDSMNRYFIEEGQKAPVDWVFSPEESKLMHHILGNQLKRHPLRDTILEKLYIQSETSGQAELIYNARISRMVKQLTKAIDEGRQTYLKKYKSAHSETITDRLVEPFAFTTDMQHLISYEPSTGMIKHFKIERIGSVLLSEKKNKSKDKHILPETDIFGITEGEKVRIIFLMRLRASILLQEEFPRSAGQIKSITKDTYIFDGMVNGMKGVGRFVMGVLGEIIEIRTPEFKKYILQQIREAEKKFSK